MLIKSPSGRLVKRLLMLKELMWSDEMELFRRVLTKLKKYLTQNLEKFSETRFKTEIKNLAILYGAEFIISKIGPHGIPSL